MNTDAIKQDGPDQGLMVASLRKAAGSVLGWAVNPIIPLSFSKPGFYVHALSFDDQDLDVDMHGKVCLVTGANGGLGRAVTEALAARGASVRMLCRNAAKSEPVAEEIRRSSGNDDVRVEVVDVSLGSSIREFVERFSDPVVDVLVNNAGVLPAERSETSEGIEVTLATNVVGPFLLTKLLMPKLEKAKQGRVINVSSGGMYTQQLTTGDPQFRKGEFDGVKAYAWTKRAEVILTEMSAVRAEATSVTFNAMHPGWADTEGVRTSLPNFRKLLSRVLRNEHEGADTIVWLAVCRRLADQSGLFWFDREPRRTHFLPSTREPVTARAWLWDLCTTLSERG